MRRSAGGVTRPAPPTISALAPAAESTLAALTAISASITVPGTSALLAVRIRADYDDGSPSEIVYSGAWSGAVSGSISGSTYSFTRPGGWRAGVTITLDAFDTSGQITTASRHFAAASSLPSFANISPAPGTPIAPGATIQLDALAPMGIRDLTIAATYAAIAGTDAVYSGGAFGAEFAGSTATPISGGLRLSLKRVQGWPATPILSGSVVDMLGRKATL